MKKFASLMLTLCMVCTLAAPTLAAGDLDVPTDTHLTRLRNIYNSVTVRSGATLSMENWRPDAPGLEIAASLTVEPGGSITGGSLIFSRSATCIGVALYYRVAGVEKPLTVTLADVVASDPNDDYFPTFLYDLDSGHYVLVANFSNDPYEQFQPDSGGTGIGTDSRALAIAEGLKALGLFNGVGTNADGTTDFALDRAPSRVEALVLLIRLLGKDAEAKTYDAAKCPFDDVQEWAKGYVAYAYDNGLTNGMSAAKFGTDNATVQQFETFVLRAMGYSDANGADFTWDHPETLAEKLGIVLGPNDVTNFSRGTCVRIMEIALRNAMKDGTSLWQKLANDGVFTEEQYKAAMPQL